MFNDRSIKQCNFHGSLEDQSSPNFICLSNQNVMGENICNISILDYTNDVISGDNRAIISSITLSQTAIAGTILNGAGNTRLINVVGYD